MAAPRRPASSIAQAFAALSDLPSVDSLRAAEDLQRAAPRRLAIPLRKSFVRNNSAQPLMSQLYRGGQSGIVAVRLHLALLWKASSPPYDTSAPARAWATLLDLDDPAGLGQRRITRALKSLEDLKLIRIERFPGKTPILWLLDESGNGKEYEPPYLSFSGTGPDPADADKTPDSELYLKVPVSLWTAGDIQRLSGPGLIMLLILLAEQAGEGKKVWFGGDAFEQRYSISHKTRSAGVKELQARGLLEVSRQPVKTSRTSTSVFSNVQQRHVYKLQGNALTMKKKSKQSSLMSPPPPPPPPSAKALRSLPV